MDMYSRKILWYEISNTMDERMCVKALEKAIGRYGMPKVMHTDRGRQYAYGKTLEELQMGMCVFEGVSLWDIKHRMKFITEVSKGCHE